MTPIHLVEEKGDTHAICGAELQELPKHGWVMQCADCLRVYLSRASE